MQCCVKAIFSIYFTFNWISHHHITWFIKLLGFARRVSNMAVWSLLYSPLYFVRIAVSIGEGFHHRVWDFNLLVSVSWQFVSFIIL